MRDYAKEYANYHSDPEQIKRRTARNAARRAMRGRKDLTDEKDVHHKDNNPMNNDKSNLSIVTQHYNRREPRLRMEDLRKWFGKGKKGDWVRVGTDGDIKGDCAREPGEGKPKCMPRDKAHSMKKKDRASSARRKRSADPDTDRPGTGNKPIMVKTDKKESAGMQEKTNWKMGDGRPRNGARIENDRFWNLPKAQLMYIRKDAHDAMKANPTGKKAGKYADEVNDAATVLAWRKKNGIRESVELEEKNVPTNPALWSKFKSQAKAKFDVYPSAYANGWASKQYKAAGGSWKTESVQEMMTFSQMREAVQDWKVTVTKPVNKLKKGASQSVKARSAFEAINKAIKLWGDPALKTAPASSFSVAKDKFPTNTSATQGKRMGESVDLEEAKEMTYTVVHAKKGKVVVKATSSYDAAQKAAKGWKLKSTAGVDAYLMEENVDETKVPALKTSDYPKGTSQSAQAFKDRFVKKKPVSQMTPAEKAANDKKRKEYNAYQKSRK